MNALTALQAKQLKLEVHTLKSIARREGVAEYLNLPAHVKGSVRRSTEAIPEAELDQILKLAGLV